MFYMNKFGMYSEGPKTSIDEHLSKLDESMKEAFKEIRNFTLALGSNVVEEVRPHRVVYGKSMIFRTFLDIQPMNDSLTVSVKLEPRGKPKEIVVNSKEQLPEIKELVKQAYSKI